MKLVRFEREGRFEVGAVLEDLATVLCVEDPPSTIEALLESEGQASRMRAAIEKGRGSTLPLAALTIAAPLRRTPHNVFCVGLNYLEHVAEGARTRQAAAPTIEYPVFFTKSADTIIGPRDEIPLWTKVTQALDYEVELAVLLGRGGRDISPDTAWDHVFGVCVANDVTARDLQRRHGQWFKGKSLDGSLPLGPWIVTRDEIGDVGSLVLSLHVNGELRQRAAVRDMIFDIPRLIAELSNGMTLASGDLILTGTPSGVGFARTPPVFLQAGDEVVCAISGGLGEIRNLIAER
jgi:2-keto-4-pentenoate hydratase/2-oxohepta-3-ene-1,7-dioic acid hydratase in catechol pathway